MRSIFANQSGQPQDLNADLSKEVRKLSIFLGNSLRDMQQHFAEKEVVQSIPQKGLGAS